MKKPFSKKIIEYYLIFSLVLFLGFSLALVVFLVDYYKTKEVTHFPSPVVNVGLARTFSDSNMVEIDFVNTGFDSIRLVGVKSSSNSSCSSLNEVLVFVRNSTYDLNSGDVSINPDENFMVSFSCSNNFSRSRVFKDEITLNFIVLPENDESQSTGDVFVKVR